MDILMITLIPLGASMAVLLGLATFWRWDSANDKATVVGLAIGTFTVIMSGWLLYRFGWGEMSWLLIIGTFVIPLGAFFVIKGTHALFASMIHRESVPAPTASDFRAAAPLLVPMILVMVIACGTYLWITLR